MDRDKTRQDLLSGQSANIRRRRAIIILSLLGATGLALGAMRQTGIIKRLPDPPGKDWDANKVTTSDDAYPFGVPDAPIALTSLAANVAIASVGGEDRARKMPWLPLLAFSKSMVDVTGGLWYLYRMFSKEKVLCAYCIFSNVMLLSIGALTAAEAREAREGSAQG